MAAEQLAARSQRRRLCRCRRRGASGLGSRTAISSCAIGDRRGARKPILLLRASDVVEAKRADWTYDPFMLTERDGYFYGRGTQDVKGGAAIARHYAACV